MGALGLCAALPAPCLTVNDGRGQLAEPRAALGQHARPGLAPPAHILAPAAVLTAPAACGGRKLRFGWCVCVFAFDWAPGALATLMGSVRPGKASRAEAGPGASWGPGARCRSRTTGGIERPVRAAEALPPPRGDPGCHLGCCGLVRWARGRAPGLGRSSRSVGLRGAVGEGEGRFVTH